MRTKINIMSKIVPAAIVLSLLVLSGCGKHEMAQVHGMDMEKQTMAKPMDDSMMKDSESKMGEGTMMDGMDMKKSDTM